MIKGIDLSTWNKNIDYYKLKEDGIDFAILRCGYGKDAGQKDEMFETHYQGCKDAGIKVGVYHYSYCTAPENAIKEAENCLSYIAGKELDLPVFYDIEEAKILNACDPTSISFDFCNRIKQEGYEAGVYASLSWFNNYFDVDMLIGDDIKIWVAQWNNKLTADFQVDIWQNTNNIFETATGRIDGDILINESLINNEPEPQPEPEPEFEIDICKSLAVDVIFGKYGNGQERKDALGNYYEEVQNIVNEIYEIICG